MNNCTHCLYLRQGAESQGVPAWNNPVIFKCYMDRNHPVKIEQPQNKLCGYFSDMEFVDGLY